MTGPMQTPETRASPLTALRFRDFRVFWIGLVAQIGGQQMFSFTLGWLAFEITGSQAQLSLIQLSGFVPQFAFTLLGGLLADRVDPRKLIGAAQAIAATGIILVSLATFWGVVQLWHLALGAFLLGLSNAIDEPTRASFFPRLLPRTALRAAVPLVSMAFGGSRVIAPSIAGFMIAAAGAPATLLVGAAGVSTMIAVLFLVHPAPAEGPSHGSLFNNFTDSLRYIRGNEVFSKVIAVALLNATVAMGYMNMLPVFAKEVLHVDSRGLGILVSAAGIGALTGLLSYPWMQARTTPRNLIVAALSAYSTALICLALSNWFWFSFGMIYAASLCHAYFMTSVQVTLQTLVDDQYRGRVMGVFTLVWSLVFLSGFLLNFAGSLSGPKTALAGGAAITLVYVWTSLVRSAALKNLRLSPKAP